MASSQPPRDHLTIIQPDAGKRYRLNIKGEVNKLTIGKVKSCLATSSSCPIPLSDMVLKLNGVPLSDDRDVCGALGIRSGTTLTVEDVHHLAGAGISQQLRRVDPDGHDNLYDDMGSLISPQRRLIELQTLEEQERYLKHDVRAREQALRQTLTKMDDELDSADVQRKRLERHRRLAEQGLEELQQREAEAAREKARLDQIRADEAARAKERAADLAARREELRAEQEAIRAVAQRKLENEKKKAQLAQQKAAYEAERQRVLLEQDSFENQAKARELSLKVREIEMEHQRLAQIREARELEQERRITLRQKLHYYNELGVTPPAELLREIEDLSLRSVSPGSVLGGGGVGGVGGLQRQQRVPTSSERAAAVAGGAMVGGGPIGDPYPADLVIQDGGFYDAKANAVENLLRLGEDLGLPEPLQFDENNTCVISVDDEYTLLVTYDAATERLFLYSTLLTTIPGSETDPNTEALRRRLYEFLLEASLLGREMCGGGIGASLQNDFILLSTSLYLPTSQPWSLRTLAPQFVQCLHHWRQRVVDFLTAQGIDSGAVPNVAPVAVAGDGMRHAGSGGLRDGYASSSAPRPASSPSVPMAVSSSSAAGPWRSSLGAGPAGPAHRPDLAGSRRREYDDAVPYNVMTTMPGDGVDHRQRGETAYNTAADGVPPPLPRAGNYAPMTTAAAVGHRGEGDGSLPRSVSAAPYRVVPVLGLEVTGSMMLNGVTTVYEDGLLVVNVAGPAAMAGVQPHDVLKEVDGVLVRDVPQFRRVVQRLQPGAVIPLRVERNGLPLVISLKVGSTRVA